MVHAISSEKEFNDLITTEAKLIVVDFTATWCGPCGKIGPVFEMLAGEYPSIVFVKVDVDDQEAVAAKCGIQAMPTFQFYKGGKKVFEMKGADEKALREAIARYSK